jgi:hypothetical protein
LKERTVVYEVIERVGFEFSCSNIAGDDGIEGSRLFS